MSDTRLVSVECHGPYQSYIYVNAVENSFFVREFDQSPNIVMVFDDGYVILEKGLFIFTDRCEEGITSWFSTREPIQVRHVSFLPGRVEDSKPVVKFINKFKTLTISNSLGIEMTFVGDSDVFVCGKVKGTIFSCLRQLFSNQTSASELVYYYEDCSTIPRLR